jgi:hypothetical protein
MKIYDETGNLLVTSINAEGTYNYGRDPITELRNGVIEGLDRLIGAYNHYLGLLRDSIGIAQGADATLPDPKTLVAVQEQAALNSNTATRHILDSVLNITERTATAVALRLKDIFEYSNLKDAYIQAVGKINVQILESIKRYHLHDFGIKIELKPDAEEKQYLENNINQALSKDLITLDDAIDIRNINNIKLANELLKIRRARREKQMQQAKLQEIQTNAEANAQAAERASQAKLQEIEAEKAKELEVQNAKTQGDQARIQAEMMAKSKLMEQEFEYNMRLKGIEVDGKFRMDKFKEDEKMRRQDRNNTQQAAMKAEGKKESPRALRFESAEDQISGQVEMDEMEPK